MLGAMRARQIHDTQGMTPQPSKPFALRMSPADDPPETPHELRRFRATVFKEPSSKRAGWPSLGWVLFAQAVLMAGALVAMFPVTPTRPMLLRGVVVLSCVLVITAWCIHVLGKRHERCVRKIERIIEDEVWDRSAEEIGARDAIILSLGHAAESRDMISGQHVRRVAAYSEALARSYCAVNTHNPSDADELAGHVRLAAVVHDIGKTGVPDAVLLKPCRLTPDERSIMEMHTTFGVQTLEGITQDWASCSLLRVTRNVIKHHHERWDGNGYPSKLAGEAIPLEARLVAVADVYDALTSPRAYKNSISHEEAVKIISDSSGTHFDPAVVTAFLAVREEFRKIGASLADARGVSLAA
jgi:putative two-component system response regulator